MEYDLNTMAGRIGWAVARKGSRHEDLAVAIGVSRPMISMWISGRRTPELANLQALAEVCDVSAAWLLGGDRVALRDGREQSVMELFRDLTDDKRSTAETIIRALRSAG